MEVTTIYSSGASESLVWYREIPTKAFHYKRGCLVARLPSEMAEEKVFEWKKLPTYSENHVWVGVEGENSDTEKD